MILGLTPFQKSFAETEKTLKVCGLITKSVKFKRNGSSFQFLKGEFFVVDDKKRVKSKEGRKYLKYRLVIGGKSIWIPEKYLKVHHSKRCSLVNEKVYVESEIVGYNSLEPGEDISAVVPRGLYPVVSSIDSQGTTYFRLFINKKFYFVSSSQVVFDYTPDQEELAKQGVYSLLGFPIVIEASYLMNYDESDYNSLVTDIPDEDDVSPLQDPLIREVERGEGFSIGAHTYFPVSEKWEALVGLKFQQVKFKYNGLSNPEYLNPIQLDQLEDQISGSIDQKSLVLDIAALRSLSLWGLPVVAGPIVKGVYTLNADDGITVRQGCDGPCLGKRDPLDIKSEVSEFDFNFGVRAGYRYKKFNVFIDLDTNLNVDFVFAYRLF